METIGISPKVKLPAGALLALGAALLAVSFIVEGAADLKEVGLSLIGASGLVGSIGYRAGPGPVAVDPEFYPDPNTGPNPPAKINPDAGVHTNPRRRKAA